LKVTSKANPSKGFTWELSKYEAGYLVKKENMKAMSVV
jgi:predicted secreted protein